ncbi:MAG: hypothetical protein M0Q23_06425 [Syntrophales bacterium]|jgi:hypothetical protein|nr:hypothetical protein [Syntrophales bacterium]MCK9528269.1 hypothetical protein [Syntrophales bacterium]MDX9922401.1 hypothetical protein [Syntrophales bacterium]
MQEILSLAAYLVVWLLCDWVIGFESGLVSLLISLGAAIGVYILLGMKDKQSPDEDSDEDGG